VLKVGVGAVHDVRVNPVKAIRDSHCPEVVAAVL
jgi:hypothetical protein